MHVFTFFANSSHARNFQFNSCYLYLSKFFYIYLYINIYIYIYIFKHDYDPFQLHEKNLFK